VNPASAHHRASKPPVPGDSAGRDKYAYRRAERDLMMVRKKLVNSTPALPLSFEERISQIRLWILPLVVLAASFAVKQ